MKNKLFILPVVYLLLPFINIHFALLALLCFGAPVIVLFYTKSRKYCTGYCPRSQLLNQTKPISCQKNPPKMFTNGSLRKFLFGYFIVNILFIVMSTIMVANGQSEPLLMVRMFVVIPLSPLFQLFTIESIPWVIHLSYRLYSMIFTTIVLGLVFAYFYRPRTWCQVCPITSVSNLYLNKKI